MKGHKFKFVKRLGLVYTIKWGIGNLVDKKKDTITCQFEHGYESFYSTTGHPIMMNLEDHLNTKTLFTIPAAIKAGYLNKDGSIKDDRSPAERRLDSPNPIPMEPQSSIERIRNSTMEELVDNAKALDKRHPDIKQVWRARYEALYSRLVLIAYIPDEAENLLKEMRDCVEQLTKL